jgi:hypothetical protein
MFQPQHGQSDGSGFRPGKTHYANSSAAGRCGNGDDGVVKVQYVDCI